MPNQTRSRSKHERSPEGQLLTDLILSIFRANVDLVTVGPLVTEDSDITAVRWLMLDALREQGKTAAQLGRDLGLSRQGALWNVQALEELGLVELLDNPEDRRAKLVALTAKGVKKLKIVTEHQADWVNRLALHFEKEDVKAALRVVSILHDHAIASVLPPAR